MNYFPQAILGRPVRFYRQDWTCQWCGQPLLPQPAKRPRDSRDLGRYFVNCSNFTAHPLPENFWRWASTRPGEIMMDEESSPPPLPPPSTQPADPGAKKTTVCSFPGCTKKRVYFTCTNLMCAEHCRREGENECPDEHPPLKKAKKVPDLGVQTTLQQLLPPPPLPTSQSAPSALSTLSATGQAVPGPIAGPSSRPALPPGNPSRNHAPQRPSAPRPRLDASEARHKSHINNVFTQEVARVTEEEAQRRQADAVANQQSKIQREEVSFVIWLLGDDEALRRTVQSATNPWPHLVFDVPLLQRLWLLPSSLGSGVDPPPAQFQFLLFNEVAQEWIIADVGHSLQVARGQPLYIRMIDPTSSPQSQASINPSGFRAFRDRLRMEAASSQLSRDRDSVQQQRARQGPSSSQSSSDLSSAPSSKHNPSNPPPSSRRDASAPSGPTGTTGRCDRRDDPTPRPHRVRRRSASYPVPPLNSRGRSPRPKEEPMDIDLSPIRLQDHSGPGRSEHSPILVSSDDERERRRVPTPGGPRRSTKGKKRASDVGHRPRSVVPQPEASGSGGGRSHEPLPSVGDRDTGENPGRGLAEGDASMPKRPRVANRPPSEDRDSVESITSQDARSLFGESETSAVGEHSSDLSPDAVTSMDSESSPTPPPLVLRPVADLEGVLDRIDALGDSALPAAEQNGQLTMSQLYTRDVVDLLENYARDKDAARAQGARQFKGLPVYWKQHLSPCPSTSTIHEHRGRFERALQSARDRDLLNHLYNQGYTPAGRWGILMKLQPPKEGFQSDQQRHQSLRRTPRNDSDDRSFISDDDVPELKCSSCLKRALKHHEKHCARPEPASPRRRRGHRDRRRSSPRRRHYSRWDSGPTHAIRTLMVLVDIIVAATVPVSQSLRPMMIRQPSRDPGTSLRVVVTLDVPVIRPVLVVATLALIHVPKALILDPLDLIPLVLGVVVQSVPGAVPGLALPRGGTRVTAIAVPKNVGISSSVSKCATFTFLHFMIRMRHL
ncbi:hypothetical protein EIP91_001342 [Steccherinum ochraceum]|uniref:Zinc finger GRF-type domain-containing protein n=1 Tax=Steccherinum ochraceum TaxID=92696 RepID=A0A4R0RH32_9APHY|nr:hypothetical protein EIP91_001342 [Steccherinum ochraceum]